MTTLYNRYIPSQQPRQPHISHRQEPHPAPCPPAKKSGGLLDIFKNLKIDKGDLILLALLALLCLEDGEEPENLLVLAAVFFLGL